MTVNRTTSTPPRTIYKICNLLYLWFNISILIFVTYSRLLASEAVNAQDRKLMGRSGVWINLKTSGKLRYYPLPKHRRGPSIVVSHQVTFSHPRNMKLRSSITVDCCDCNVTQLWHSQRLPYYYRFVLWFVDSNSWAPTTKLPSLTFFFLSLPQR